VAVAEQYVQPEEVERYAQPEQYARLEEVELYAPSGRYAQPEQYAQPEEAEQYAQPEVVPAQPLAVAVSAPLAVDYPRADRARPASTPQVGER